MRRPRTPRPKPSAARPAGRPRNPTLDAAILRATTELLLTGGVAAATVNAVARRAGVARASIYLRHGGREAMITAAIRAATGREPIPVTGDLEADLHRGADQARAILSSKPFRAVFPRLVEGLLHPPHAPGAVTYAMIAPNRPLLVEEFRALAQRAGFRPGLDADLVVDLLIGGLVNRLLVTGTAPSHTDAERVVDILLEGLRVR